VRKHTRRIRAVLGSDLASDGISVGAGLRGGVTVRSMFLSLARAANPYAGLTLP
jgi:hypothetical protein